MVSDVRKSGNVVLVAVLAAIAVLALLLQLGQNHTAQLKLDRQSSSESTGSTTYPRRATDENGYEATIQGPKQRVASQYWSIDEMLYSVLPAEHIVGVSQYAYDRNTSNVLLLAERYRPVITANPETVFTAAPDLLLVSSSARADLTDLVRKAGIPTFRMFTEYKTLDQIAHNITLTGYLTGQDNSARRVLDEYKHGIERAVARKPLAAPSPRVLGYSGKYSYGSQTSFNDVLRLLGATNVAAEHGLRGYDAVNTEQILRWNPDWLISRADPGDTGNVLQRLLNDPAIASTSAAQKKQILVLENRVFLPMSPFTVNLLDALSEAFYGTKPKN